MIMIITQPSFNIRENPFKEIWVGELAVGLADFFVEIFQIAANMYIFLYINTNIKYQFMAHTADYGTGSI